jgi:hypothetical protein
MRFFNLILSVGILTFSACKSTKNNQTQAAFQRSAELRERMDLVVGHCTPERGNGNLLYFGLDSMYFVRGFLEAGYQVSVLGTDERYEAMQRDPYMESAQLPLIYYNNNGIKTEELFSVIFFDRIHEKWNMESISPLLSSAYTRLNDSGKLVLLLSKKQPQIVESHLSIIQSQVELRKWHVDTSFSANYQILTLVK